MVESSSPLPVLVTYSCLTRRSLAFPHVLLASSSSSPSDQHFKSVEQQLPPGMFGMQPWEMAGEIFALGGLRVGMRGRKENKSTSSSSFSWRTKNLHEEDQGRHRQEKGEEHAFLSSSSSSSSSGVFESDGEEGDEVSPWMVDGKEEEDEERENETTQRNRSMFDLLRIDACDYLSSHEAEIQRHQRLHLLRLPSAGSPRDPHTAATEEDCVTLPYDILSTSTEESREKEEEEEEEDFSSSCSPGGEGDLSHVSREPSSSFPVELSGSLPWGSSHLCVIGSDQPPEWDGRGIESTPPCYACGIPSQSETSCCRQDDMRSLKETREGVVCEEQEIKIRVIGEEKEERYQVQETTSQSRVHHLSLPGKDGGEGKLRSLMVEEGSSMRGDRRDREGDEKSSWDGCPSSSSLSYLSGIQDGKGKIGKEEEKEERAAGEVDGRGPDGQKKEEEDREGSPSSISSALLLSENERHREGQEDYLVARESCKEGRTHEEVETGGEKEEKEEEEGCRRLRSPSSSSMSSRGEVEVTMGDQGEKRERKEKHVPTGSIDGPEKDGFHPCDGREGGRRKTTRWLSSSGVCTPGEMSPSCSSLPKKTRGVLSPPSASSSSLSSTSLKKKSKEEEEECERIIAAHESPSPKNIHSKVVITLSPSSVFSTSPSLSHPVQGSSSSSSSSISSPRHSSTAKSLPLSLPLGTSTSSSSPSPLHPSSACLASPSASSLGTSSPNISRLSGKEEEGRRGRRTAEGSFTPTSSSLSTSRSDHLHLQYPLSPSSASKQSKVDQSLFISSSIVTSSGVLNIPLRPPRPRRAAAVQALESFKSLPEKPLRSSTGSSSSLQEGQHLLPRDVSASASGSMGEEEDREPVSKHQEMTGGREEQEEEEKRRIGRKPQELDGSSFQRDLPTEQESSRDIHNKPVKEEEMKKKKRLSSSSSTKSDSDRDERKTGGGGDLTSPETLASSSSSPTCEASIVELRTKEDARERVEENTDRKEHDKRVKRMKKEDVSTV
ncbi:central domain galactose oxidase [Cystoisospora suis]|uniref:Central domain galactose oxidase n=1 Tax=Cystoisospora suis TaxID=483139 RepID=A0A2C6KKN8_9APIC|nr:central domain galactose oxidase [Cystoisospora suis]